MMSFLYSNEYTHSNQAGYQAEAASCAKFAEMVHSAPLCAVCTFIFALSLIAIRGAIGVLIRVAIIAIIGIIIIWRDNRICKGNELLAVS